MNKIISAIKHHFVQKALIHRVNENLRLAGLI